MAVAMSPTTEDAEVPSEPVVTRRRVLAAAGAGIVAMGVAPGVAEAADTDVTVTQPDPVTRRRLRAKALADPESVRLLRGHDQGGWHPRREEAIVHRTDIPDVGHYHTVSVPLDAPDLDGESVLLWTDEGPFPTQIRSFLERDDGSVRMTSTTLEEGTTVTEMGTVQPTFWWYFCSDLNWACVLSVAGAWAGAFASCAACVADPTKLTCLACIGAILTATGGTLGCEWCNG